jgi:hypothetical protein
MSFSAKHQILVFLFHNQDSLILKRELCETGSVGAKWEDVREKDAQEHLAFVIA